MLKIEDKFFHLNSHLLWPLNCRQKQNLIKLYFLWEDIRKYRKHSKYNLTNLLIWKRLDYCSTNFQEIIGSYWVQILHLRWKFKERYNIKQ